MLIDRPAVKAQARLLMFEARPRVLTASLLVLLLSLVVSYLSSSLLGFTRGELERYMQYVGYGDNEAALNVLLAHEIPRGARLLYALLSAAAEIVSLGFLIFLLNTVRRSGAAYGNLLDGFACWWKLLLLALMTGLLVALGTLLLVVPGLVLAYRYRMARYLLITRPELGPVGCMRESARLTKGHKMELFLLDLSFIGWVLLSVLPMIGWAVSLWLNPYRELSFLLVFERICGVPAPAEGGAAL